MDWLTSPEAEQLLTNLPPYDEGSALSITRQLRAKGVDAEHIRTILTQSRLRSKARSRWGDIADQLILTSDGAEQSTRPVAAAHRARRYANAGVDHAADLGCGLALDAMALAAHGVTVTAFERDEVTAAAARANVASLGFGDVVEVRCADVTGLRFGTEEGFDGVYADPARRRDGRRISSPEQWSPPLSWVLNLPASSLGVKVAPGLAHDLVPAGSEFEVVSIDGDVVEAGIYRGELRSQDVSRRATLLPDGSTLTDHDLPGEPVPTAAVGRYLYEPAGAVIRSGLVAAVADQMDGWLIDPLIAYISSDAERVSPYARGYHVLSVMPFNVKKLRAHLRSNGVGRITIKKRGSAIEPETLRRQLHLDRSQSGEATVVATRLGQDPVMLLVEPLTLVEPPTLVEPLTE
ncbi:MAG: methyltransferase domain-containing protein [Candidatus Nanopelagicales bacterium]